MTGKGRPGNEARAIRALVAGMLALCFVVDPTAGSLTWLNLKRTIVRKAVNRHIVTGIEASDLVLLRFSKAESESLLRWEHSREFEYDGQMYDIVEAWAVGDTVFYRCWWDREETALNNRMRTVALRALGDAPRIGDRGDPRGRSLHPSCFVLAVVWTFRTPGSSASWAPGLMNRYLSIAIPPLTPPPRPA